MDRLAAMESFVQVVADGSFSTAARQLGLSKSLVSKHVAALEQHLGARLLNRSTRRLSLTEAGEDYFERCREILAELAGAEAAVSQLQAEPRGRLRINAPLSFGLLHLAPRLPGFLSRYPQLQLEVDYNDRFVDLVHEGYDVAVRVSAAQDSGLRARTLATCGHLLCASPSYLEAQGAPQNAAELSGHNCLCYSYQPYAQEWRLQGPDGRQHRVSVTGNLRANNGEALLAAATAGQGIILCPEFICAPALAEGRLQIVLPGYHSQRLMIQAVYPYTRHVSAKLRAFIDYLVASFREVDWRAPAVPPAPPPEHAGPEPAP